MSFSASTCLTNAGTTPLGPILSAYTDTDSYLNPFASVLLTQITGSSCPYVFTNIPPGTTNIRLIDPTTSCCITIPIQSDNFCNTCNLDFNYYPLVTDSQILAGELIGSCQSPITDYVINWYGPNSATNIAFKSGKGSTFSSLYQFTHPLTGSSFIFAQAGVYTPVIDRVQISGYTFVNTGGTGVYDATLDCFNNQQVQVNPLFCGSGNTPTSAYTHSYYFSGTGAAAVPLNVTFQLSANTNYFAYSFTGQTVPDNLRITYSGANTSPNLLVLENITVGNNPNNSQNLNSFPARSQTTFFRKVLCLTGITRSAGDNLTIQLTPNPGQTEWALNMRCFSSFDCTTCIDTYRNSNLRIIKSSITITQQPCYSTFEFKASGCSVTEFQNTNIGKYYGNSSYFTNNGSSRVFTSSSSNLSVPITNYNNATNFTLTGETATGNSNESSSTGWNCRTTAPAGTMTFNKYFTGSPSVSVIDMIFTNPEHTSFYYNKYLSIMNGLSQWGFSGCSGSTGYTYPGAFSSETLPLSNYGTYSGGTWTGGTTSLNNSTDIRYYRSIVLTIPTATGSTPCAGNSQEACPAGNCGFVGNTGSPTGLFQMYHFHTGSIVTTGITGANTYMRIAFNPIQLSSFNPCLINGFNFTVNLYNTINKYATGTTYLGNTVSFTNTTGSMSQEPFYYGVSTYRTCTPKSANTVTAEARFYYYDEVTYPKTVLGEGVPAYSAKVCNYPLTYNPNSPGSTKDLELLNCSTFLIKDPTDFEVYCRTMSNFSPSVTGLAYRYSGGSEQFCNPTYVVGC
jgi:hypothetical protein